MVFTDAYSCVGVGLVRENGKIPQEERSDFQYLLQSKLSLGYIRWVRFACCSYRSLAVSTAVRCSTCPGYNSNIHELSYV